MSGELDAPDVLAAELVATNESPVLARPAARRTRAWLALAVYPAMYATVLVVQTILSVAWLIVSGQIDVAHPEKMAEAMQLPGVVIALMIVSQALIGLFALAGAWFWPGATRENLGLTRPTIGSRGVAACVLASLAFVHLGDVLLRAWVAYVEPDAQGLEVVLEQIGRPLAPIFWLVIMAAPAICEELFFRGFLQRALLRRWRPATVIVVVALCFTAMHLPISWMIGVLPLSFWLGIVAWRTGSTWPGIACHAFINGYWTAWPILHAVGVVGEDRPAYFTPIEVLLSAACLAIAIKAFQRTPVESLLEFEPPPPSIVEAPVEAVLIDQSTSP